MRAFVLGLALVVLAPSAQAQQSALVRDPALDRSSVDVILIAGSPQRPISGQDVKLVATKGKTITARTNEKGKATFSKVPDGVEFVATVELPAKGGETKGQTIVSEKFSMPSEGGVRVLMTSEPLNTRHGSGAAAPASGGAGAAGMPDPRNMSGIARPEGDEGTLMIRGIRGKLSESENRAPVGEKIHLVAYGADGTVTKTTKEMDAGERVYFENLDTTGNTSYYAMSVYERAGVYDRLTSESVSMPPKVGMKMMLAGHGLDSGEEAADDLTKKHRMPAPEEGVVLVRVVGDAENAAEVELVEIGRPDAVAKAPLSEAPPTAEQVTGQARPPVADSALGAGTVVIELARTATSTPVVSMPVEIQDAAGAAVGQGVSDGRGTVTLSGLAPGSYRAKAVVFGKELLSETFTLGASGGVGVAFGVNWTASQGGRFAYFSGIQGGGEQVYLARVTVGSKTFRSFPFQLTPKTGAAVNLLSFTNLDFAFHGGVDMEDRRLRFSMQFIIANFSEEAHDPGPDGILIPLPDGFVGASVEPKMSAKVSVDKERGLIWRGRFPSGQKSFMVNFAMEISNGGVVVNWPTPSSGFKQSSLMLEKTEGVEIEGPDNAQKRESDKGGRTFLVVTAIEQPQGTKLNLVMKGLPQAPPWHDWFRGLAGLSVVLLFGWGISGLFRPRVLSEAAASRAELETRKEKLFDRLVQLEKQEAGGKGGPKVEKQRKKVRAELEEVVRELDA